MILRKIKLINFRSYKESEFNFGDNLNFIVGKNGVGKTNVLEAIYVLMVGKSFRDKDEQLINYGQDFWKIEGLINDNNRQLRYQINKNIKKEIIQNVSDVKRFTFKNQLPVILFEPDDMIMIHSSPVKRRSYIDDFLSKLFFDYKTTINKYERVLTQRNNLLKSNQSLSSINDLIFAWDVMLSEYSIKIINKRKKIINDINKIISEQYSLVANSKHSLEILYKQSVVGDIQKVSANLKKNLSKDVMRGFTSIGPHCDDFDFLLDGKSAKFTASRGEIRTLILALKKTETTILSEKSGIKPILLFDDIFGELDECRQKQLINNISDHQTIITTTALPIIKKGNYRTVNI